MGYSCLNLKRRKEVKCDKRIIDDCVLSMDGIKSVREREKKKFFFAKKTEKESFIF